MNNSLPKHSRLHFSGAPEGSTWKSVSAIFGEFGTFKQLFIKDNETNGFVRFETVENAHAAYLGLNNKPPYNLQLFFNQPGEDKESLNNSVENVTQVKPRNKEQDKDKMNTSKFYKPTISYVDIFGNEFKTVQIDGKIYILSDDLVKIGLHLFPKDKVPDGNKETIQRKEFEAFVRMKAYEFIFTNKYLPTNQQEIVDKVTKSAVGLLKDHTNSGANVPELRRPNTSFPSNIDNHQPNKSDQNNQNWANESFKSKPQGRISQQERLEKGYVSDNKHSNSRRSMNDHSRGAIKKNSVETNGYSDQEVSRGGGKSTEVGNAPVLIVGETYGLVVASIQSIDCFYGYLKCNESCMEQIMVSLSKTTDFKVIREPYVGQICAADYLGDICRARVISTSPLKVYFIDYGNESLVKEAFVLDHKFVKIPPQAISFRWSKGCESKITEEDEIKVKIFSQDSKGTYVVHVEGKGPQATSTPEGRTSSQAKPEYNLISEVKKTTEKTTERTPDRTTERTPEQTPEQTTPKFNTSLSKIGELVRKRAQKISESSEKHTPAPPKSLRCLLDETVGSSSLDVVNAIDPENHVVFPMPDEFIDDLAALENLSKPQTVDASFRPVVGECVMATHLVDDADKVVRAQIIKKEGEKYTVALVDYGETISVTEVYPLLDEYFKIPQFTFVLNGNEGDVRKIKEDTDVTSSWKKGTYEVTINFSDNSKLKIPAKKWNPIADLSQGAKSLGGPSAVESKPQQKFTKPLPKASFTAGDQVKIMGVTADKLYLINREGNRVLNEINGEIQTLQGQTLKNDPIPGQIVLCPHVDGKLTRALVQSVGNLMASVHLIDHGIDKDKVPVYSMINVNEQLASYPETLLAVTLKDFDRFSVPVQDALTKYSKEKQKFILKSLDSNSIAILNLPDGEALSNILLVNENPGLYYRNLSVPDVQVGSTMNLVLLWQEAPLFWFCDPTCASITSLSDEIERLIEKEPNFIPYIPREDEVIIAWCEGDEWFRAVVKEFHPDNTCDVFYIDYGNDAKIPSSKIRKMPAHLAKIPTLCICCEWQALKEKLPDQDLCERVNDTLGVSELAAVKFLGKVSKNRYNVDIPELRSVLGDN